MTYDQTLKVSEDASRMSGIWCLVSIGLILITTASFCVQTYYGNKSVNVWDEFKSTNP